jgi:hypothetical protein
MKQFTFTVPLYITVTQDEAPTLSAVKEAALQSLSIDLATENAENVTDSGGEVTSAYVDWETLEMLDDDGIPSEES